MSSIKSFIQSTFKNENLIFLEEIQSLWSGYGSIERWQDNQGFSIIVKHIKPPAQKQHPKGWNSYFGHNRKVKSYEVETAWYKNYADRSSARVPSLLANSIVGDARVIVLEDLDAAGFEQRINVPNQPQYLACISWLAQFHACFLDSSGEGLWDVGTYWNLGTRPEELKRMEEGDLKEVAAEIDEKLNTCKYKTLVHGDAKLANFCFGKTNEVAAVDFQYVGKGAGIKDLIYFISSVGEFESAEEEGIVLDFYFNELAKFLGGRNKELEIEWRGLYKYAWADFNRFLQGWSPGHWKLNNYINNLTQSAIKGVLFKELSNIAERAAKEAGDYISLRLGSDLTIRSKAGGLSLASSVVTEVDEAAQQIIFNLLQPTLKAYNLGLLSEESKDDESRFEKEFFWCVDPLDGTLPFTEQVEGFSVAISLISKKGEPIIGVVYDPYNNNMYKATKGEGALKNNTSIKINKSGDTFTFITDRSLTETAHYPSFLSELKTKYLKGDVKQFKVIAQGGASMNALWLLDHAPAAYIKPSKNKPGGGGIWDFAATACIFNELGLRATNYNGGQLDLNRLDSTYMNHEGVYYEVL